MANNNNNDLKRGRSNDPKRERSSSDTEDENQIVKKRRPSQTGPLATSAQLVQAINVELSSTTSSKRSRSKSSDPSVRNVRAKMSVDLSSSNPEPVNFLMGTIANELENINRVLSSSGSRVDEGQLSSSSSSMSHSPSPPSSQDSYDRLVAHGYDMLERMRQDPDLHRFF